MYNLPQQPINIFQAIGSSINLWLTTLGGILPLAVISSLLNCVPLFIELLVKRGTLVPPANSNYFLAALLIVRLLTLIPYAAIIASLFYFMSGQPINNGMALDIGLRKFLWLIILLLLYFIIIVIPFTYLTSFHYEITMPIGIIIITYVSTLVIFTGPLIVIENLGIISALKKSIHLVNHNWWRTFIVLFVAIFIMALVRVAGQIFVPNSFQLIFYFIILALFPSFYGSFILTQLHNLEMRHSI